MLDAKTDVRMNSLTALQEDVRQGAICLVLNKFIRLKRGIAQGEELLVSFVIKLLNEKKSQI